MLLFPKRLVTSLLHFLAFALSFCRGLGRSLFEDAHTPACSISRDRLRPLRSSVCSALGTCAGVTFKHAKFVRVACGLLARLMQGTYENGLRNASEVRVRPTRASGAASSFDARRHSSAQPHRANASHATARLGKLLKMLLELGGSLASAKELRELFVHIADIAEFMRISMSLNESEVVLLFESIGVAFPQEARNAALAQAWQRFLAGVMPIVMCFMAVDRNASPDTRPDRTLAI